MKSILYDTKNKANFNTSLLSTIRLGREDNRSYKERLWDDELILED